MGAPPVLTLEELRALEARHANGAMPGLMTRAGRSVAEAARSLAADTGDTVLVAAGPGNNGGDAWVAAEELREGFHRIVVLDAGSGPPRAAEARAARQAFEARGGAVAREWPDHAKLALVVDGLFGVGLARDLDDRFRALVGRINGCAAPVLAIDVPSGIDSSTGRVRGAAVNATRTLTFIAHKLGLHTGEGVDHCGGVELDELGAGEEAARMAHGFLLRPG
ncbi:MAG TPA: NAD(P)H-hydrate epimerase, partial [Usitatibacter sp.]|nr:NAD(P)H-hydrate epimerase [Usitatibacter sp.]